MEDTLLLLAFCSFEIVTSTRTPLNFLGIFVSFLGISEITINNITFGAHTTLGASLFILSGYQALLMHSLSLDISERLSINRQKKGSDHFRLEDKQWTGISLISFIIGISLWAKVFFFGNPKSSAC